MNLVAPTTAGLLLTCAGLLLAGFGAAQLTQARRVVAGVQLRAQGSDIAQRTLIGGAAGAVAALIVIASVLASGIDGRPRLAAFAVAGVLVVYGGISWPAAPLREQARLARLLRRLTPSFTGYLRVAIGGGDSPHDALTRYVARPRDAIAPMQQIVRDALLAAQRIPTSSFAALRHVARFTACQELIDLSEALAQAEESSASTMVGQLVAQEQTLAAIIADEDMRLIKRRKLYVLCFVAYAMIMSTLVQILYVNVLGSALAKGLLGGS